MGLHEIWIFYNFYLLEWMVNEYDAIKILVKQMIHDSMGVITVFNFILDELNFNGRDLTPKIVTNLQTNNVKLTNMLHVYYSLIHHDSRWNALRDFAKTKGMILQIGTNLEQIMYDIVGAYVLSCNNQCTIDIIGSTISISNAPNMDFSRLNNGSVQHMNFQLQTLGLKLVLINDQSKLTIKVVENS